MWKHRASAQGCCDECFCVKVCRFIFAFHYLWVSVSCFFLNRNFNQIKISPGQPSQAQSGILGVVLLRVGCQGTG